ncbi:FecR family protein [Sinomicrobium oceani]|uniref:FecR family protein n=1 Tax=Sinomicrobium oceani TaxID=1150368 RepID=UPI00227A23B7|nr:FecR domain-containing protein [Sinomicrobium oceani]
MKEKTTPSGNYEESEFHRQAEWVWQSSGNTEPEDEILRDRIWTRIRKSIRKERYAFYRLAAAAVLVVLISVGLGWYLMPGSEEIRIANENNTPRHITLEDGSKVILNRHSSLTYHTSRKRKVRLSGEAFFDISRDTLHPFEIETEVLRVTVLGTRFNVYAYHENPDSRVSLYSGKVSVGAKNGPEEKIYPGEEYQYNFENNRGVVRKFRRENAVSWTSSLIRCNDTPLEDLFIKIENYYGITLVYDPEEVKTCHITGTFKMEDDISGFFRIIGFSHNIHIEKITTGKYRVISDSCK